MPSFSCASTIRVASQDHVLRLKITHNFVHDSPSNVVHRVNGRLPKELDVLWLSDIAISFSGSLDGHEIGAHAIACSGLVHHLETRLKANADRLGLNNISRPFVDDTDGLSKLTLTPSRPLPGVSRPHTNLISLHLAYMWRTSTGPNDVANSDCLTGDVDPFSPTLFLPAETLLNRATEQFLIYHLVSRYPLIFGSWCKRFDVEMPYFPSIGRSIVEIMSRSSNQIFLSKCKRLIKAARKHHKFVIQSSIAALSCCTDNTTSGSSEKEIDVLPVISILTDEQVLCESLEQLFRMGVSRRRFKPAGTFQLVPVPQDDDTLLQHTPAATIDDGETSWIELPEIAMSPCALLTNCSQTTDTMDVFSQEDWFDDKVWNVRGADTNRDEDEDEINAQSDESLISASVPLSITTRSMPACTFTLYHHNDHEPQPAGSGLRYSAPHLAHLEESGAWGWLENPIRASHDHQKDEQLMETRQAESESIERVDSDWILSDGEGDIDASRQMPDDAGLAEWEEALV